MLLTVLEGKWFELAGYGFGTSKFRPIVLNFEIVLILDIPLKQF